MMWIFGLITGLAFDMPIWWWVMGFFMALLNDNSHIYIKR